MRHAGFFAGVLALLAAVGIPSEGAAQKRSTPDFLDAMLRDLQEFRTERGTPLTRPGVTISVDLTGLDTALVTLGVSRVMERDELQRRNAALRFARYNEVASCRANSGGERCVLPAGVVSVRFFSPRAVGSDAVSFSLGTYERRPGDGADAGTGGVVYDVVARRDASGWKLVSAKPKYIS